MLDAQHRGVQANSRRLTRAIQRGEVDAVAPYGVDRARSVERAGDERLDHESREAGVAVREHLVAERVVAVFGKLCLDRVGAVAGERVGPEAVAAAFAGRQEV